MNVHFDGIYTGFMANETQVQQVFRFLDTFYKEDTFLVVDPIMGDEGIRFSFCTDMMLRGMKELVSCADVVTPNLMELCLLTNAEYKDRIEISEIEELAAVLLEQGIKTVVVTGIRFFDEEEDRLKIGNLTVTREQTGLSAYPYIGGSFSGTGDLFASVVTGGLARGDDIFRTVERAGAFIKAAMSDAVKEKVPRNEGANFEKYLGMLLK